MKELTYIIKQDIANINKQIASLQHYVKSQGQSKAGTQKQIDEHNSNVVMLLQSKLANTSMSFKDVLEIRTQVRCPPVSSLCHKADWASHTEHERVQGQDRTVHVHERCSGDSGANRSVTHDPVPRLVLLWTYRRSFRRHKLATICATGIRDCTSRLEIELQGQSSCRRRLAGC